MLKVKYILLAFYGVLGVIGWSGYIYEKSNVNYTYDNFSSSHTVSYVRSVVWYHSRGKLQELRAILLNDDMTDKKLIQTRIENMLKHRTSAYIREFNGLTTPLPNLGDWYSSNFDFANFLDDVFLVVFKDSIPVDTKIRNVADVMEQYQNQTTVKLINQLNSENDI